MLKLNLLFKTPDLKMIIEKSINDSALSNYSEFEFVDNKYAKCEKNNDSLIIFSEINDLNDIKTAYSIKTKNNADSIIYVSNNNDLVFDSLSTSPLNFIRLSNFDHDFCKSIKLIIKLIKNKNLTLIFKTNNSLLKLNTRNIIFVESFGHYLTIHCTSGQYRVREKISAIENDLGHANFSRIHKSYIVNKNFIKEVFTNKIILTDGSDIPIGKSYKESLANILV